MDVLISIREPFAAAILSGTKPYELRRYRARLPPETTCWVYVPRPTKAVAGCFRVAEVVTWSLDRAQTAETYMAGTPSVAAVQAYLQGATVLSAIGVAEPRRFHEPVVLDRPPPQRYAVLRPERPADAALLRVLVAAASR